MKRKRKQDASQQKAWLDWLNDDTSDNSNSRPPQQQPTQGSQQATPNSLAARYRRPGQSAQPTRTVDRVTARPIPRTTSLPPRSSHTGEARQDNISINIHLPQLHMPKIRFNWRKFVRPAVVVVAVGVLLVGGWYWRSTHSGNSNDSTGKSNTQGAKAPAFTPVKPNTTKSDKSVVDTTVAYDPQRQLYKFNDTYEDANIVVSEQILPEEVRKNPDTLQNAAASIGATDSFQTSFGTVYVATAPKGGAQRLVFTYQKLLVFISSDSTLDNVQWSQYILSLR